MTDTLKVKRIGATIWLTNALDERGNLRRVYGTFDRDQALAFAADSGYADNAQFDDRAFYRY